MESIIGSIITGGLALVGVVFSNLSNNKKIESKLSTQQAVTDTKLEELTREVRTHNNFAQRVPVLEEQIKVANNRIKDLENLERREK
jgi:Zn-dependent M32 family carboxypeptidase